MDICDWEKFWCRRWNLSFLRSLLTKHKNNKLFLIPIKLQINFDNLKDGNEIECGHDIVQY